MFLPYQKRWIRDGARLKLMEKSRQVGMSWATAYSLVRRVASGREPLDIWVASRDEVQARLFLADCRAFAEILDGAMRRARRRRLLRRRTRMVLEFSNGKKISGLSCSIDAQAGKRGTRILDEFALHMDPQGLYAVAYPGITWGGSLEILSTHRGADNFFNHLVQEARCGGNPKDISLHRVTLEDALNQGLLAQLKRKLSPEDPRQAMDDAAYFDYIRRSCVDEATFLQEYMCVPEDESALFLTNSMIEACEYPLGTAWEWNEGMPNRGDCYLGMDLGRHNDRTVFWLLERDAGLLWTRKVLAVQGMPFSEQEGILYSWARALPRLRRICIDATGMGAPFAERVGERLGRAKVEGVTFTAGVKGALACSLRFVFLEKQLRLPADKTIRADLRSLKRSTTAAGHVRLGADRSSAGHADHFWALALAAHAAGMESQPQPLRFTALERSDSPLIL